MADYFVDCSILCYETRHAKPRQELDKGEDERGRTKTFLALESACFLVVRDHRRHYHRQVILPSVFGHFVLVSC